MTTLVHIADVVQLPGKVFSPCLKLTGGRDFLSKQGWKADERLLCGRDAANGFASEDAPRLVLGRTSCGDAWAELRLCLAIARKAGGVCGATLRPA